MRVSIARALVDRARDPADGRAVRAHSTRSRAASSATTCSRSGRSHRFTAVFATHSVFEIGLPLQAHRGDGRPPRPCDRRDRAAHAPLPRRRPSAPRRSMPIMPGRLGQAQGGDRADAPRSRAADLADGTDAAASPGRRRAARARAPVAAWQRILAPVGHRPGAAAASEKNSSSVEGTPAPTTSCPAAWPILPNPGRQLGNPLELAGGHAADHLSGPARHHSLRRRCWRSCSPSQSGWRYRSSPTPVILQVTPIVAIAPLIIIWVNDIALRC